MVKVTREKGPGAVPVGQDQRNKGNQSDEEHQRQAVEAGVISQK
jgi:hypothetical protein